MFHFDLYGWYTPVALPDRATELDPGEIPEKVVGQPYPNWLGESWGMLPYAEPLPLEPALNPTEWLIDVGPFFDRFGAQKMAVLTSTNVNVKAILADLQVRKWIDLKREDVAQGLAFVGSVVNTVTTELQDHILNTPVTEFENLALRKLYFS